MEKVKECFRTAIKMMNRYNLSLIPEVYTVCFKYASGDIASLNEEIDSLLEKDNTLTTDTIIDIYKKYFTTDYFIQIDNIYEKLKKELLENLNITKKGAEFYKLKNCELKNISITPENIEKTIKKAIYEIDNAATYSKELQDDFEKSEKNIEAIKQEMEKLKKEAIIDPLTRCYNRRGFEEAYKKLLESDSKIDEISLIFIDIDNFKQVNDNYGHLIGDEVLKFVAKILKNNIKGKDILGRFGGEEFLILAYNTPYKYVVKLAENLRKQIATKKLKIKNSNKNLSPITISLGVARKKKGESLESLIERADKLMYISKKSGKNRVTSEDSNS